MTPDFTIANLAYYTLSIWLTFYLWNYSDLLADTREWLFPRLPIKVAYAMQCSLCYAFWAMIGDTLIFGTPPGLILTVPVGVLFLNLAYLNLRKVCADSTLLQ